MLDDYLYNRAFAFKEIEIEGEIYFLHFDVDETELVPGELLSQDQHQALLAWS